MWSDEEVIARWKNFAPEETHEDFVDDLDKRQRGSVIRTDHYLVMTNSSGGPAFAKQLEKNYERIQELYPFEEVPGRKLLPIYLFRERDEYLDFYVKIAGTTREDAAKSAGHAWKDYYATYYQSPKDPVHIHEQTHQIFGNRLRLNGGGSWFQEGVAEFIESNDNELNDVARYVKKRDHTPLRQLVGQRRMIDASRPEDLVRGRGGAGENYKQAALLIEFLMTDKRLRDKFPQFLVTVGRLPRNDVEKIDAALQRLYDMNIEELEEEWIEYCEKR